jgi:hypothetical protein
MPLHQPASADLPIWWATPRNDRGMQDVLEAMPFDPAQAAARALAEEQRPIVVCTGFPVKGQPETDGPPGAFALIDALRRLGKSVKLASWDDALEVFRKVRPDLDEIELIRVPAGPVEAIEAIDGMAVVTIEICGRCADGSYRNMRRVDIGAVAPRFEDMFGTMSLVSFGDGGNEFGMGSAPDSFFEQWQVARPVSRTQNLVPASISNYGAYAAIKELEGITGTKLLPDPAEHVAVIRALVELGCVDGFTGEAKPAVDGQDLGETEQLLQRLRGEQGPARRAAR